MRINTKCSIALHCLIVIFTYGDKIKVTSEVLAKSTGSNSAAIRSILNALQRADIVSVARGVGGAHLNCRPEELTVWEVYHAVEPDGLNDFIGCHPNPSVQCPIGKEIKEVLGISYSKIGAAVKTAMQEITFQQILEDFEKQQKDSY